MLATADSRTCIGYILKQSQHKTENFTNASAGVSLSWVIVAVIVAYTALRVLLAVNARTYLNADLPA